MNDASFWKLIARLGIDLEARRLAMALGALSNRQFFAFGCHLRSAVGELDGPLHRYHAGDAREHVLRTGRLLPLVILGPGSPALREVQMTVVALGRDAWSAVVAVPVLLEASWPCALGRKVEALSLTRSTGRDGARGI